MKTNNNSVNSFTAGPGPMPGSEQILLFDLGNILVRLREVDSFWRGTKNSLVCQQKWDKCQAVYDLETGKIDDLRKFYELSKTQLGITLTYEEFVPAFISIIGKPFAETHALLTALKTKFKLMLLSNTSRFHWEYCAKEQALGQYFTKTYLSYQIGSMKPDELIYRAVLADIGTSPQNIWFFDDKYINVEAAAKYGINAYESRGGSRLTADLKKLNFIL